MVFFTHYTSFSGFPPTNTPQPEEEAQILEFQTRTCLSILLCSFLWPIKTCLLLAWEAQSVYGKLESQIVKTGKQLYFLGILGRHKYDIFNLRYEGQVSKTGLLKSVLTRNSTSSLGDHSIRPGFCYSYYIWNQWDDEEDKLEEVRSEDQITVMKLAKRRNDRIRCDLLMLNDDESFTTMYNIQIEAQYFVTTKGALFNETYVSDILNHLMSVENNRGLTMIEIFKQLFNCNRDSEDGRGKDDWDYFQELLNVESLEDTTEEQLKRWLERAHKSCVLLANALSSAKEVGQYLDRIITVFIISASFIFWLILTGLATTNVLVLVTSPLLAVTFIFGDTCKTIFQGIIFVYVVRPYDVGDLCVVDKKRMVVKAIDVWKTTFLELNDYGYEENVVMYPNSKLNGKKITYPKTEFDWDDQIVFGVASLNKSEKELIIESIEGHLIEKKDEYMLRTCSVLEVPGDKTKINVRVKYKISKIQDETYYDYRQRTEELRDAFVPSLHKQVAEYKKQIELEKLMTRGNSI